MKRNFIILISALLLLFPAISSADNFLFRRIKPSSLERETEVFSIGNVKVIINSDYEKMSQNMAKILMERIHQIAEEKGEVKIGLPTGNTPLRLYEILRTQYGLDPVWGKVILIQLDEYVGAGSHSPESFQYQIRKAVADQLNLKKFLGINGDAEDIQAERERYERELKEIGALDILVLGIGRNGHLAFNEPGFKTEGLVGIVELTEETKIANGVDFTQAITISLNMILQSREIFLLASGEGKKIPVERALLGEVSFSCPASFLQLHPQTTFILDEKAVTDRIRGEKR
ncbi:MAG: 6-phosphogluconolactonase [Candidatus Omnitrophota bacterium]